MRLLRSELPVLRLHPLLKTAHRAAKGDSPPSTERRSPRTRLALLEKQYRYPGNQTCAGDGLCSMSCPMGINTGDLTHIIRQKELPQGSMGYKAGNFAANHFAGIKKCTAPRIGTCQPRSFRIGNQSDELHHQRHAQRSRHPPLDTGNAQSLFN